MEANEVRLLLMEIIRAATALGKNADEIVKSVEGVWDAVAKESPPSDVEVIQYDTLRKQVHETRIEEN